MMLRFLVWLYVSLFGVKFYKLMFFPNAEEYRAAELATFDNKNITFRFYNYIHDEYVYQKNVSVKYKRALLIHATYDDDFSDEVKKYSELVFYFPGPLVWFYKERVVSEIMIMAYLDVIRHHNCNPGPA